MGYKGSQRSSLDILARSILKGEVDLLTKDSTGRLSVLEEAFVQATQPQPDRQHAALSQDQYDLQHALFKRLAVLSTSDATCKTNELVDAQSYVLSSDRQLFVVEKVAVAMNDSNKNLSRAAAEALQGLVALSSSLGGVKPGASPLGPVGRSLLSVQPLRSDKGVYQILSTLVPTYSVQELAGRAATLPESLLDDMGVADNITFRGALLAVVYSKVFTAEANSSLPLSWQWTTAVSTLADRLVACDAATRFNLIQYTVRPLAEAHAAALSALVQCVEGSHSDGEEAWIALVSLGMSLSLCSDLDSTSSISTPKRPLIPVSLLRLEKALTHPSPVVRLGVFRLITDKTAVAAPVTQGEWDIVRSFFAASMNVWDSDARSNLVARTSYLLRRLKNSSQSSHQKLQPLLTRSTEGRSPAETARVQELQSYLRRSEDMLSYLVNLCFDNLIIGGSYPRNFVSLRLLSLLIASSAFGDFPSFTADVQSLPGLKASEEAKTAPKGKGAVVTVHWPTKRTLFPHNELGHERVRKVIRCLKNTFTDVRTLALSILEQSVVALPTLEDSKALDRLHEEALAFVGNPRGSESTTGALALRFEYTLRVKDSKSSQAGLEFASDLLAEISRRLKLSHLDVISAASTHPVHGLFCALQQILPLVLSEPSSIPLFQQALDVVSQSWESTRRILSSASAENAAEEGEDEVDHEEARAAKMLSANGDAGGRREKEMLLSWAWRTMRESSALLSIVARRLLQTSELSAQVAHQTGVLYIAFLSEIRHPGAFLSIFPHYSEVIASINFSSAVPAEVKSMPEAWLKSHLTTIGGSHKTAGRRSAGLPYAILGVALGQPALVPAIFESLFNLAEDGNEETGRIAAINTLKVLCNNSKMALALNRVYEQAVTVAMHSLSSPNWGVRNVGLQLMGALVKKGFGKNSTATDQNLLNVWFSKFPTLHGLFIKTLGAISQEELDASPGAVFVVLQFLRCLRASPSDTDLQDAFLPHIERFSRCKQIDIRLAAAAASPSVVGHASVEDFILAASLTTVPPSQNALHGKLSQIIALLHAPGASLSADSKVLDYLREAQQPMLNLNPCGATQALFVQVIQVSQTLAASSDDIFGATHDFCRERVMSTFKSSPSPGEDSLNLACARFIVSRQETASLLPSPHPEVVEIALSEPSFTAAPLDVRMAISATATSSETALRARTEALAWAHRFSKVDFTKVSPAAWDRLYYEFEGTMNLPLKQALVVLLGKAIGQCASIDRVEKLVARLNDFSEETQSVDSRLGAIASLSAAYSTLSFLFPSSHSLHFSTLALVSRLSTDDDALVRALTCALIGCVGGVREGGLSQEEAERFCREHARVQVGGLTEWRKAVWGSLVESFERPTDSPNEPFVLFAAEPENAFLEPERELSLALSSASYVFASSTAKERAAMKADVDRLGAAWKGRERREERGVLGEEEDGEELRRIKLDGLRAIVRGPEVNQSN